MKKKLKRAPKSVSFNRQRGGVSKLLLAAIVAIVLAGAGGMYVMSLQPGSTTGIPFVKRALNPNCELNDPELCKFINNWKELENYRVTSVTTTKEGKSESIYEIAGKDKTHMVSSQDGKEVFNIISIGNTTYTKDYTDNKWSKYVYKEEEKPLTEDMKETFAFDDEEETEKEEVTTTYKSLGKEACGELQCFKYQIIEPEFKATQYIWFDDKDYLMRKQRVEDEENVSEMLFSYNAVNITEPSPVKEGGPAGSMGGTMPIYSEEDTQKMMEEYQQWATETTEESGSAVDETPSEE